MKQSDYPDPAERNCYCSLWEKNPATLEKQGVPRGYCGFCDTCGKPGHIRHFPGAVPFTGAWCDRHYERIKITHPLGSVGFYLWVTAVILFIGGAIAFWRLA